MADVFLRAGEVNPTDIVLRDPTTMDAGEPIVADGMVAFAVGVDGQGSVVVSAYGLALFAPTATGHAAAHVAGDGVVALPLSSDGVAAVLVLADGAEALPFSGLGEGVLALVADGDVAFALLVAGEAAAPIHADGSIALPLEVAGDGAAVIAGDGLAQWALVSQGDGLVVDGEPAITGDGLAALAFVAQGDGLVADAPAGIGAEGYVILPLSVAGSGRITDAIAQPWNRSRWRDLTHRPFLAEIHGDGLIELRVEVRGRGKVRIAARARSTMPAVSSRATAEAEIIGAATVLLGLKSNASGEVAAVSEVQTSAEQPQLVIDATLPVLRQYRVTKQPRQVPPAASPRKLGGRIARGFTSIGPNADASASALIIGDAATSMLFGSRGIGGVTPQSPRVADDGFGLTFAPPMPWTPDTEEEDVIAAMCALLEW